MITIISYIAGGGGNHLKNLMSLDQTFANSLDLDLDVYQGTQQPPGVVHSVPGRNIRPDIVERMLQEPMQNWLLHGHWGELMPYRQEIGNFDNRWLLVTINTEQDKMLIKTRHNRLHQHTHPYWVDEEQAYLYQPEMYQLYFKADTKKIFTLSLEHFWNPDLGTNNVIQQINEFFGTKIDPVNAQNLHQKWWNMNFCFEWDLSVRDFYNVK